MVMKRYEKKQHKTCGQYIIIEQQTQVNACTDSMFIFRYLARSKLCKATPRTFSQQGPGNVSTFQSLR